MNEEGRPRDMRLSNNPGVCPQHFYHYQIHHGQDPGWAEIRNPAAIHFITFSVVVPIAIGRVDVFTRKAYCDVVLDSIRFCQLEKGLALHAWCLMSNHLHLIASAKNEI